MRFCQLTIRFHELSKKCAIIFIFELLFIQIQNIQLSSYLHCALFKIVWIFHFLSYLNRVLFKNLKNKPFLMDNQNMRTNELFYERLERLLKDKNMQQKELAEKCEISSNGISTWKVTGTYPRANVAVKLANALGVSVEYLITGEIPGVSETDKLAYEVSRLPPNKRKVVQAVVDSLSAFD